MERLRSGIKRAAKNPAIISSIISLLAAVVAGAIGYPQVAVVLVVATVAFSILHAQMITRAEARDNAIRAAVDAATTTAANLTILTVGQLGEVTGDATKVVTDAVGLVTGLLGVL